MATGTYAEFRLTELSGEDSEIVFGNEIRAVVCDEDPIYQGLVQDKWIFCGWFNLGKYLNFVYDGKKEKVLIVRQFDRGYYFAREGKPDSVFMAQFEDFEGEARQFSQSAGS